jgi:hypothetical protein
VTGYSLAAQYQSIFYDTLTVNGRIVSNLGITLGNYSGNDATGIYGQVTVAGGTNRWNLYLAGNAPAFISGALYCGTTLNVTGVTTMASLGIGGAPYADTPVHIRYPKNTAYGLTIQPSDADTGGGWPVRFYASGGVVIGSISASGTNVSYNTSSDVRLKHAFTPLRGALDVVRRLRPGSFFWNATDEPGEGFLAHELMREVPLAVTGEADAVHPDGTIRPQQADYSKLVPWLVGAVQELTTRLAALEGAPCA